ncbi:MAG: sulfite exporter TauE/SafE family protein [Oscillospiraceae bacterium]|nr:sulfite exporter TauE/SafE family protein [Oscillospiraceae bacterium]
MRKTRFLGPILAGSAAGIVNGLFGAGGGMLLVPLLCLLTDLQDDQVFPASVCVIFPICIVSLLVNFQKGPAGYTIILYLLGSCLGGILAGLFAKKIPTVWLHRTLGILILWGGIRYLC